MAKINVLSKEISELIAAGEVIERPSSVIKELIENSIDSGANSITVEIKNGGISYMRITDNGCGIADNDVATAFLRHATSKIITKDDLQSILTLGFRGEALASISAVSKAEVLTKLQDEQYGTHYVIEGSEERLFEKSGCPNGTTILIRDIFYNVPARLKFLKKDVTEANAISSIVNKIALSHPEISIKLIRDNKQEIYTPGDGDLFSTIYAIFGKSFAQTLIPVNYTSNKITVKGYTVKPLYARANRSFQSFFINDRYVKSMTCTVSLEEAYRNSIMVGKFPACILNIAVPPNIVDVNVHPAKIEVRFSDEKMIFDSVYFAIKNSLLTNDTPTELHIEEKSNPILKSTPDSITIFEKSAQVEQMQFHSEKAVYNGKPAKSISPIVEYEPEIISEKIVEAPMEEFKYINKSSLEKKQEIVIEKPIEIETPKVKIIGEAFLNYIIAEVDDKLLLIDKHAAHERLIFEKIKSQDGELSCQMLLEPIEVMLSYEEYDALMQNVELMVKLGFSLKEENAPSIIAYGIPTLLDSVDPNDIILEIAKNLIECKHNPQSEILDELYHSIACKSAIKANDKNDIIELKALVEKIYGNDNIRYCPHGRPVMITLTKKELEKQFKRIL